MLNPYDFIPGSAPLLVSIPHAGTQVPEEIAEHFTPSARSLPDTDWHLDRLYGFAAELGASLISGTHSRYVVDLNRPPNDARLYETTTTGLIPAEQFDGKPIYADGYELGFEQRVDRVQYFYKPYHEKLQSELSRIKAEFGFAILFDAHSIRSHVPRFFDGQLPDLNVGTNDGQSADAELGQRLIAICQDSGYTHVANGRFKGGYITRYYGKPEQRVHAVQLEMAQCVYLREDESNAWDETLVERLMPTLRDWIKTLIAWRPDQ